MNSINKVGRVAIPLSSPAPIHMTKTNPLEWEIKDSDCISTRTFDVLIRTSISPGWRGSNIEGSCLHIHMLPYILFLTRISDIDAFALFFHIFYFHSSKLILTGHWSSTPLVPFQVGAFPLALSTKSEATRMAIKNLYIYVYYIYNPGGEAFRTF